MKREKINISKSTLIKLYEVESLSCEKIGKKLNCSESTICNLLKSYGIQTRKAFTILDRTGQRYGLLLVLKREESSKQSGSQWLCRCDCGNEKIIAGNNLVRGNTKSCGCLLKVSRPNPKKGEIYPNSWVTVNCVICGKEKTIKKSRVKNHSTCGSKGCMAKRKGDLRRGENNYHWLNGMVGYDTAVKHFEGIEDIRRSPHDPRILEVRCLYCNRWFQPTKSQVNNRKIGIGGVGGNRFYCSDGCKESCPTFNQPKLPKGFRRATSREVDPALRKMVLERDNWTCQKCGSNDNLHIHHIEGYTQNKMTANDMDNCITLCKICHKWVHTLEGCNYFELRCK